MNKDQAKSQFLFDNRIVQRNIRDNRVEREAFEKHLATLPDLADKCEDIGDEIYGTKRPGLAVTGDFMSSENDE